MFKLFIFMVLLGIASLITVSCEKKSDPPVVEQDLLPEDELDLLDEPDLESVEDSELVEEETFELAEMEKKAEAAAEPAKEKNPPFSKKSFSGTGNFSGSGKYVVQVSIFKSRRMADKLKNKLSAMGYPAYDGTNHSVHLSVL